MLAPSLRVLVVLSFLLAVACHWAHHFVPSSGARTPALAEHCDQHLHYSLSVRREADDAPAGSAGAAGTAGPSAATGSRAAARRLGGCRWSCSHLPGCLRESLEVRIEDATLLPGWSTLASLLPDPELRSILHQGKIELTTDHDDAGHCTAVDASFSCAMLTGYGHATLNATQLVVNWKAAGTSGRREYPAIPPVVGLELVAVVPAQLRPGDRCTMTLVGLDSTSAAPRARPIQLHALATETVDTPLGWQSLTRIESSEGEERLATLWCDATGLIWKQRWDALGLELELDQRDEPGDGR